MSKSNSEYRIALNFLPVVPRTFTMSLFRRAQHEDSEQRPEGCHLRKLPVSTGAEGSEGSQYAPYWTSFEERKEFEPFTCDSRCNTYLTLDFLHRLLVEKTEATQKESSFEVVESRFRKRVYYTLAVFQEGEQRFWLEAFFLRTTGEFGFLCDFRFSRNTEIPFNRRVQQLSLSLDDQLRENKNFYVDRFEKFNQFKRKFLPSLSPLVTPESNEIVIKSQVRNLAASNLRIKEYVMNGNRVSTSQFLGVKRHGPLKKVDEKVLLYFVYKVNDKPLSYDLFRALRGDTYRTFPGMESMFGYSLGEEHVGGVSITDFTKDDLGKAIRGIKDVARQRLVVPVVLLPWDREHATDEQDYLYYWIKHEFLKEDLPTQFVSLPTLRDREKLKWSVSNIGLGIFAKMGGFPWKVKPQNDKCLIIGIGQSHLKRDEKIERYLAYSVLTDSSGVYESVEILGKSRHEAEFIGQFKKNLTAVLHKHGPRFECFTIHSTFSLRKRELDAIKEVLKSYSAETGGEKELVALKFNDRNKFFGYAPANNSLIPYESCYLKIANSDYLVWFEGLQYKHTNVQRRIGGPMHVEFIYPHSDVLSEEKRQGHLQDALNLSGANWRGFNAKSSPVSVYYAYQMARFFKNFTKYNLEEIDLFRVTPWFL